MQKFRMNPMQILSAIGLGAVLWLVCLVHYKLKRPRSIPSSRPRFVFFPKYSLSIELGGHPLCGDERLSALRARLASEGFRLNPRALNCFIFDRGRWFADSFYKRAETKYRLRFPKALPDDAVVTLEYGAFAFFDTGLLWAVGRHLAQTIEVKAEVA